MICDHCHNVLTYKQQDAELLINEDGEWRVYITCSCGFQNEVASYHNDKVEGKTNAVTKTNGCY